MKHPNLLRSPNLKNFLGAAANKTFRPTISTGQTSFCSFISNIFTQKISILLFPRRLLLSAPRLEATVFGHRNIANIELINSINSLILVSNIHFPVDFDEYNNIISID